MDAVPGADAVEEAIGAEVGGVVGEDGDAGLDAGLDEHGLEGEEALGHGAEGGVEWRDDGGDGDAGDDGEVEVVEAEEALEEQAELVGGVLAVGGGAPSGDGLGPIVAGEVEQGGDDVGVADVKSEEHGLILEVCASLRSAA